MSHQTTNNLRLLGIGIILCSFVVPGPQIDSLANLAMIGLLADWAYRIVSDTKK
jgi:hypothetical protein